MSLTAHLAVFAILIVDLALGAWALERTWGHWPAIAFEFTIILGYVVFVLQLVPWRDRGSGPPSSQ